MGNNHFLIKTGLMGTVIAAAGLLSACASTSPKVDAQAGDSLQRAKQAQTITPTPAQRRAPTPAVTSAEVQRAVSSQTDGGQQSGTPTPTGGRTGGSSGSSSSANPR